MCGFELLHANLLLVNRIPTIQEFALFLVHIIIGRYEAELACC